MSVSIRSVTAEQLEGFYQSLSVPFLFDSTAERFENFRNFFDHDRHRAAFDGDQIVGTIGAHSLELVVPGNTLPTGGTSAVTVLPTHRRQGVLRALMREHFRDVRERGEPLAALWASETSIYGRFGYGCATERASVRIDRRAAQLQKPVDLRGAMRLVSLEEAEQTFPQVYKQVTRRRPGMFRRDAAWWKNRILFDGEFRRGGASAQRRVLHCRDDRPVGYAIFRTQTHRDAEPSLLLVELVAIDADAEKALWQFVFGVDLIETIEHWNLPLDSPLPWWLEQSRKLERKIEDALWIRPMDVAVCLSQRRYAQAGQLTFRMRDELCPWNDGVFRLEAGNDGGGCCTQVDSPAELELTPFGLGSTYLGGVRFATLAEAGVISGAEDAVARADALFGGFPAPWCQEIF